MKDVSFSSNGKLFEEVEQLKKIIRDEIYNKSRNLSCSPSFQIHERSASSCKHERGNKK